MEEKSIIVSENTMKKWEYHRLLFLYTGPRTRISKTSLSRVDVRGLHRLQHVLFVLDCPARTQPAVTWYAWPPAGLNMQTVGQQTYSGKWYFVCLRYKRTILGKIHTCIQQRKATCLLSIRKSLACARASKLTTNMHVCMYCKNWFVLYLFGSSVKSYNSVFLELVPVRDSFGGHFGF